MASNFINVNPQMQQWADNAVVAARDKFGVGLDFTENSLQQLDTLLQQAHQAYKQVTSNGSTQNTPIDNTVRVWGSYLGEVIRRSLGGEWIVDQNNVFLQLGSRRLNPLGQVRSWIKIGTQQNVQSYIQGLKSGIQENLKGQAKLKKCPYCAEEIQEAAIVCKHCGRDLGIPVDSIDRRINSALVKCTDCGKEISPEAESCPHCGKPSSILHCPFCKSTNVMKKSSGQLAAHALGQIFGAGPFARPPKLYFCNNCKHSF